MIDSDKIPQDITSHCHIKIDKEGKWYYDGKEMIHRKIYLFFNQLLKKDEDGKYFIEDNTQRCYLEVEDTPFVIVNLEFSAAPSIILLLNDETKETLLPGTLRIAKDNVVYCQVKGGKYEARFSRKSYYKLARYIDFDQEKEEFFLIIGSNKYYLPPPAS